MYQTLLTSRYLTSRVIPLIAVAAVALCVTLVVVVVSVMSGFLNMVQSSGRTLMGDVAITYGVSGIPHYEKLIEHLEKDSNILAATPIVEGLGFLRMPYPDSDAKKSETVQVWGIEPVSFAKVTSYGDSLLWKSPSDNQRNWLLRDVIITNKDELRENIDDNSWNKIADLINESKNRMKGEVVPLWNDIQELLDVEKWDYLISFDKRLQNQNEIAQQGLSLSRNGKEGIVSGLHVSEGNKRQKDGSYKVHWNDYWWLPRHEGTLTMIPIDGSSGTDLESKIMPFVNEFQSGVYMIDDIRIFVPINVAQELIGLDKAEYVNENNVVEGTYPASATSIFIRGIDGISADELRKKVENIYDEFYAQLPNNTTVFPPSGSDPGLTVHTWKKQQEIFTGAVEKEKELMRTLFSFIYLVVAALILSIFWSIVYEKTRDIGILRSIGASRAGIVWIFIQYSLVIGVIGSVLGLLFGWLITKNINSIHEAMGNPPIGVAIACFVLAGYIVAHTVVKSRNGQILPIVLGSLGFIVCCGVAGLILYIRYIGGIVIWNAEVYYFSNIPNEVDWYSSIFTALGAIVFCLIGALIPAAKAADTDPVRALRHE